MVKFYIFFGKFFKYIVIPVFLGGVVFFFYRKIERRVVDLERDVKSLDLSVENYNALEMRLETNISYIANINSELSKRIASIRQDVDSLSEKIGEMKTSVVTLDCLEEKFNSLQSSINIPLEEAKPYTNSGEVTRGKDDDGEDEEEEDEDEEEDDGEDDEEDEKEGNITVDEENRLEKDDGEKKDVEDSKDDNDAERGGTNIVADGKSKTESDDDEDFDNEDNTPGEELDKGLEEYDAYNDDIFFNDTDRRKGASTQSHNGLVNESVGKNYSRDKEVENLIQSLEQAKSRIDDLERIASKYETGYSFFKLQMCLSPSLISLIDYINPTNAFKDLNKNEDNVPKESLYKFPFSFFLSLPFSRILPMVSFHCSFYKELGNNEPVQKKENNELENNQDVSCDVGDNINNIGQNDEKENIVKKNEKPPLLFFIELEPTMFCVSLLRIIKTSFFFLDFGFKIYYPEKPDESALVIVKNFWGTFISKNYITSSIFLGFRFGPQVLCFFGFSIEDWQKYKEDKRNLNIAGNTTKRFLLKNLIDKFKIEISFFEFSL